MLNSIKLISFDLDDALYDNQPVIAKAETISKDYLQAQFKRQGIDFNYQEFLDIRRRLLALNEPAYENMSFFRQQALQQFCRNLADKEKIEAEAFRLFIEARSQVSIPLAIQKMITKLASQFILVTATNGNCDPRNFPIAANFTKNYSPVMGYRAKPHPEMLLTAIQDFELTPQQVLHVGDCKEKDGIAAQQAGTHFVHFTPFTDRASVTQQVSKLVNFLGLEIDR